MINAAGGPGRAKAIALAFVALGVLFLALITMPQPVAHKGIKVQYGSPSILCLVSLAYQMHIFWMTAFVLAMIEIPDVSGRFQRIYRSVKKIAEKVEQSPAPVRTE